MTETVSLSDDPALSNDGVHLIGDVDESLEGVLPNVLSLYEQQGYRRGYDRAVLDLLASLVSVTEDFIRIQSDGAQSAPLDPGDLRRLLYHFGQNLEQRLQLNSATAARAGYVSDGLGI
jgi:hypothetical protein